MRINPASSSGSIILDIQAVPSLGPPGVLDVGRVPWCGAAGDVHSTRIDHLMAGFYVLIRSSPWGFLVQVRNDPEYKSDCELF